MVLEDPCITEDQSGVSTVEMECIADFRRGAILAPRLEKSHCIMVGAMC